MRAALSAPFPFAAFELRFRTDRLTHCAMRCFYTITLTSKEGTDTAAVLDSMLSTVKEKVWYGQIQVGGREISVKRFPAIANLLTSQCIH